MKTITLGSEVYVTDPCYEPDLGFCNKINISAGDYIAIMKENEENRVESLTVTHKDYVNQELGYTLADFIIDVDSGQAGVVDKEYYDENQGSDKFYHDKLDTWVLGEVDATKEQKVIAKEIYALEQQMPHTKDEDDLFALFRKISQLSCKHNLYNYAEIVKTGKTKEHVPNLATPDNKGAFTITAYGDGVYRAYLAKNKENKIISIKIKYE